MPQIKIIYDASVAGYKVRTPYSKDFVDTLHQLIPVANRMWDPVSKTWTVSEAFGLPIRDLCYRIWGSSSVMFFDKTAAAQAQASASGTNVPKVMRTTPLDEVLLTFVKLLPYNAARRAYLVAATELHPDKQNGDSSKMSAMNSAWTRIETDFYKKGVSNA